MGFGGSERSLSDEVAESGALGEREVRMRECSGESEREREGSSEWLWWSVVVEAAGE